MRLLECKKDSLLPWERSVRKYRVCLGCMEDWTYSEGPLCPACKLEHEIMNAPRGNWRPSSTDRDGLWDGLTLNDIDQSDIRDGFYVSSLQDGDVALRETDIDA